MSSMDLASALAGAGGGGGPPGPADNTPYDLSQGPPPAADDQAGAGADQPAGGELFTDSMQALDMAEEALHAFIRMDPDEVDRAQAGSALTTVLKLKAANQKSAQSGDMKSLQRALSGAPSGLPGLGG